MNFREIADTVLRRVATSDETEIVCIRQDESLTRFANNHIHQNVTETNYEITIRCVAGTRVGTAVSNDIRADSLRALVERAAELASLQPENPEFKGLPGPVPMESIAGIRSRNRVVHAGTSRSRCRYRLQQGIFDGIHRGGIHDDRRHDLQRGEFQRRFCGIRVHDCRRFHGHHEWNGFGLVPCPPAGNSMPWIGKQMADEALEKVRIGQKTGRHRARENACHSRSVCNGRSGGNAGI